MRREPFEIKKKILNVLRKHGEMSLRELDIKVNTNYNTIRKQVEELEFFSRVVVTKHKKNKINGRPWTSVKLKY